MKIGIDTLGLNHGRSSVGSYLISLLKTFPTTNNDVSIELFGSELDRYTFDQNSKFPFHCISVYDDSIYEKFWHLFSLSAFCKKAKFDVVVYSVGINCAPMPGKTKGVAIVHEIISESLKHVDSAMSKFFIKRSLKKSALIIVASNYIKNDLIKLGIKGDKIKVVYTGLDHSCFYPHEEITGDTITINPFSIKRPFFIYASSITQLEKNHINLIRAFSIFKDKTHFPHRLVLSGDEGEAAKFIHKELFSNKYASDIFVTGHFPYQSLPQLYSCAEACVFPSSIEGVALPVLEAMATGVPVLCANCGALPEIVGENALFYNPKNPNEIADCLIKISSDAELKKSLAKKGLEHALSFTLEKNLQMLLDAISKI